MGGIFAEIEKLIDWADSHALAAVLIGFIAYELAYQVVKRTKTKVDDQLLDVVVRAVMRAIEIRRKRGGGSA